MGKRELIGSYRDLDVYKMAMDCAIRIFDSTKSFPLEERFSLVDQIRPPARRPLARRALLAFRVRKDRLHNGGACGFFWILPNVCRVCVEEREHWKALHRTVRRRTTETEDAQLRPRKIHEN